MLLAAVTECISILPVKLVSAMCVRYTIENSEYYGKTFEHHKNNIYVQVVTCSICQNSLDRCSDTCNFYRHIYDDLLSPSTLTWAWLLILICRWFNISTIPSADWLPTHNFPTSGFAPVPYDIINSTINFTHNILANNQFAALHMGISWFMYIV